jgi:hypothetical protein
MDWHCITAWLGICLNQFKNLVYRFTEMILSSFFFYYPCLFFKLCLIVHLFNFKKIIIYIYYDLLFIKYNL